MTRDKKTVSTIIIFIFVALALVAFLITKPFSSNSKSATKTSEQKSAIDSEYIAVYPSFGPLVITVRLPVTFQGETATGTITEDQNQNRDSKINLGQDVVLYDQQDFAQPLGGIVSDMSEIDDTLRVTVDLPEGTDTDLLSPYIDIITLETTASKRLPKTAIMRDENNQAFVWRAFPDFDFPNAYKLSRLEINVGRSDQDFFEEAGFKIKSDDLVIVNPNDEINEDTAYLLNVSELSAYLHNPIRQAWITLELDRLKEQQRQMIKVAEECGTGTEIVGDIEMPQQGSQSNLEGSQSSSCSNNNAIETYEGTDPFLIFQNLVHEFQHKKDDPP